MGMERVNKICTHPLWQDSFSQIQMLEKDREFCRHDIAHFLDVGRIAYIDNLEKELGLSKEAIYATALLHDIGRHMQYLHGIPHHQASVEIAKKILSDCGFDEKSQSQILYAIDSHRDLETAASDNLAGIIYRADKKSRNCMFCEAAEDCNWSNEKKNLTLIV